MPIQFSLIKNSSTENIAIVKAVIILFKFVIQHSKIIVFAPCHILAYSGIGYNATTQMIYITTCFYDYLT